MNGKPKITLLSLGKVPFLELDGSDPSLFKTFASLFKTLQTKADVSEIKTTAAAEELFAASEKPDLILATDGALAEKKCSKVREAAVQYVRSGGVMIFGCNFSSFTCPPDVNALFASFSLPWTRDDYSQGYHRAEFSINKANTSVNTFGLIPRYSQTAVHLKNVAPKDAIYLPTASSTIQTPAAFGSSGAGKVGYIGDLNAKRETDRVVLTMCGLL